VRHRHSIVALAACGLLALSTCGAGSGQTRPTSTAPSGQVSAPEVDCNTTHRDPRPNGQASANPAEHPTEGATEWASGAETAAFAQNEDSDRSFA
jgi:hypothetical protein